MRRQISMRLATILLLCGSCSWLAFAASRDAGRPEVAGEFYFHHDHILGTSLDVWLTAPDEAAADRAEAALLAEVERLRRIFSTYDPDSELSRLNRTRAPFAASPEM